MTYGTLPHRCKCGDVMLRSQGEIASVASDHNDNHQAHRCLSICPDCKFNQDTTRRELWTHQHYHTCPRIPAQDAPNAAVLERIAVAAERIHLELAVLNDLRWGAPADSARQKIHKELKP